MSVLSASTPVTELCFRNALKDRRVQCELSVAWMSSEIPPSCCCQYSLEFMAVSKALLPTTLLERVAPGKVVTGVAKLLGFSLRSIQSSRVGTCTASLGSHRRCAC